MYKYNSYISGIIILSVLSAILLAFAFPPLNLFPISFIALTPLIIIIYKAEKIRYYIISSAIFVLIFFGYLLMWVSAFMLKETEAVVAFLALFTILFLLVLLFYFPAMLLSGFISKRLPKFRFIIVPIVFTFMEYMRNIGFLGFPWGIVGYSQWNFLPFIQIADTIGLLGISFIIYLTNAMISHYILLNAEKIKNKNKKIPENIKNTYLNLASSFLKDNESVKSDELQKLCKTIQENLNEAENRISTHNQNIANNDNQNEIIYTNKFSNKIEIIKNKVTELLEKNIKKQDILIIPYTNKTVKLLNSEINNKNEININTINNLVLEIINKSSNENLKIENTNIENLIKEKLNKLLEDDTYLAKLCKYLIHYHFKRKSELEFTNNEELNKYYKQNERLTLKGEIVNNFDEVDIANFLYENQIEYKYQDNIFNLINSGIVIKYSKEDVQKEETNTIICYAKEKLEGKILTNLYNHLQSHNVQFNPMPAKDLWTNLKKQNQNILDAIGELYQTVIMQLTTSNQNLENFNTSLQIHSCNALNSLTASSFSHG